MGGLILHASEACRRGFQSGNRRCANELRHGRPGDATATQLPRAPDGYSAGVDTSLLVAEIPPGVVSVVQADCRLVPTGTNDSQQGIATVRAVNPTTVTPNPNRPKTLEVLAVVPRSTNSGETVRDKPNTLVPGVGLPFALLGLIAPPLSLAQRASGPTPPAPPPTVWYNHAAQYFRRETEARTNAR